MSQWTTSTDSFHATDMVLNGNQTADRSVETANSPSRLRPRWQRSLTSSLWRIAYEIVPLGIGCVALTVIMQLVIYLNCEYFQLPYYLSNLFSAVVAPFLFCAGAICQLVGVNRQSRFWNWQSSLAISWPMELAIQVLCVSTVALLCFLCNLGFGQLLFMLASDPVVANIDIPDLITGFKQLAFGLLLYSPILASFLLVFENKLFAVVSATTISIFSFVALMVYLSTKEELRWSSDETIAYAILWTALVAVTVRLFGWRWRYGQFGGFRFGTLLSIATPIPSNKPLTLSQGTWLIPSQLLQTFRQISAPTVFLVFILLTGNVVQHYIAISPQLYALICATAFVFGNVWLGLSVFDQDKVDGQFAFISDRGVSPTLIYVARFGAALLMAFGLNWIGFETLFEGSLLSTAAMVAVFSNFALARVSFSNTIRAVGACLAFIAIAEVSWLAWPIPGFTAEATRTDTNQVIYSLSILVTTVLTYAAVQRKMRFSSPGMTYFLIYAIPTILLLKAFYFQWIGA